MRFSERLKHARMDRGLRQDELADLSGIHKTAVSHFESGRREPCLANLVRLVNALEVSADDLLGTSVLL